MTPGDQASGARGGRLHRGTLLLLFAAALIAHLRLAGASPVVFDDTFNDETEVRACVLSDSCTLVGVQTSIPGLYHAVGWLELRSLVAWLGGNIGTAHLTIQALNALAVVLIYQLASSLAGPLAGVAAVCVLMDRLEAIIRVTVLYNSSLLFFLGTVFVLACTAAVLRPGPLALALAALVAAVLANTHLACAATGVSLLWLAFTAPRRRFALALFAITLFTAATVALAPPGWLRDVSNLVLERGAVHHPTAPLATPDNPMLPLASFGLAAWLAAFAVRSAGGVAYRRDLRGAIAVVVPFLAGFWVASRFGFFPEAKYLIHLKPAVAITAALPLATLFAFPLRRFAPRLLAILETGLPLALAVALVALPRFGPATSGQTAATETAPTFADLSSAARVLVEEHGWDADDVTARLRSPDGIAALTGLRQLVEDAPRRGQDANETALLLTLPVADVAAAPPSNWRVLGRAANTVTVLVVLPSRIDWSDFEICARQQGADAPRCERGTWRFDAEHGISVPNMPPGGHGWHGTLRLTFDVAAASGTSALFLPRLPGVCGGRIAAVSDNAATLSADRRHAVVPAAATRVELVWEIGGNDCPPLSYDGLPPFFVEGEASATAAVESALRRREQ